MIFFVHPMRAPFQLLFARVHLLRFDRSSYGYFCMTENHRRYLDTSIRTVTNALPLPLNQCSGVPPPTPLPLTLFSLLNENASDDVT